MGLLDAANRRKPTDSGGGELAEEYRGVFVAEAREHLEQWESALLTLEKHPDDPGYLNEIFRAIHTIKGSAGFIGFAELQRVTHDLESALQSVRDGEESLTSERTDLLFEGLDLSARMVESFAAGESWNESVDAFLERLSAQTTSGTPTVSLTESNGAGSSEGEGAGANRFHLSLRIVSQGREAYLRAFLLRSRLASVATIIAEDPPAESLGESGDGGHPYSVLLTTGKGREELEAAANIDQVELVSIREDRSTVDGRESDAEPGEPDGSPGALARHRDGSPSASVGAERSSRHDEIVRVSAERLDKLLNLVGELVVQNSSFVSLSEQFESDYGRTSTVSTLREKIEGLGRITRDLQDGIMKARMHPIESVLARFRRVVRDLARSSGKEVELELYGGETEIDKKVIDRIGDPLVHLVRNAVDHGIETKEERSAAGKPAAGLLRLGAYQNGDHICIEVVDDGKGLDRAAILRTAREKGLVEGDEDGLTEEQVNSLIFFPGFSTAERITDISGRGVGMDVVKESIEELGGTLQLHSAPGRGTQILITLPLTTAIIRALLVEVAGIIIAVPLAAVNEVLKVRHGELQTVGRQTVVRVRDEVLSMVFLRELLELDGDDGTRHGNAGSSHGDDGTPQGDDGSSIANPEPAAGHAEPAEVDPPFPVVAVDYDGRRIGMAVDRVRGTQEIVVKSLSRHYEEVEGFIGATILGDGTIALIVDVEDIVRQSQRTYGESIGLPAREASSDEREAAAALEELYERASSVLVEIGSSGALRASMALSQITGLEIRVGFPDSSLERFAEVGSTLGGEEQRMAGIYVGITGELDGGILMMIPEEKVALIHGYLSGRQEGSGEPRGEEIDMSAIAEFGNLLSASFVNAISDEAEVRVRSMPPEVSIDMCLALLDSVVARHNYRGDRILVTKAVVYFGQDEEIGCSLILLLAPHSLETLLASCASAAT